MAMKTPQIGIFNEEAKHFYFLEYRFHALEISLIKQALAKSLQCDEYVSVVVSFGLEAWHKLQPNWSPYTLQSFSEIQGQQGHMAPSTQVDVFFWVQGLDISTVYDQALKIDLQMRKIADLTLEERGFDYHHKLDLMGFEDGTANPKTDELKRAAALIAPGLPGEGGALVLSQKWVHDMASWDKIPVHCQEAVIGRTKQENEELEGDAMPIDSHVSRTDLKVEGVAMKVYRRSAPFGTIREKGLFYLAFGCELLRFTSQLESMYGLTEDQKIDQILNYSKAVSGGYWFAPSQQDLDAILRGF